MPETIYAFPFPVLEEGNTSFPNATYAVAQKEMPDASSLTLTHKLENAPFLQKLLDTHQATYACLVAIPITGYRRLHTSKNPQQKITWDKDYMADSPMLRPLLLATKNITHTLGKHDGVADIWHGQKITIPKGARLAHVSHMRRSFSAVNLLDFKLDKTLGATAMELDVTANSEFCFIVNMGERLHQFMTNPSDKDKMLYHSICVNAVARAFEAIKSDHTNGKQPWGRYPNLKTLADELADQGLPMWDDEDFDPALVATALFPIIATEETWQPKPMPSPVSHIELDAGEYATLRRTLLKEKGSEAQKALLGAVRQTDTFLEYINAWIPTTKGEVLPIHKSQLTEDGFKHLSPNQEYDLHKRWQHLTPAVACRPSLWGKITLDHIKAGIIESHYLASTSQNENGLDRIDNALASGSKKTIDDVTRTILRQLGGLPEARGNRSVYVDCPFARAWWRVRIAKEVHEADNSVTQAKIHALLNQSQTIWEKFIVLSVSRNSVLGDNRIRSALVSALTNAPQAKITGDTIETLARLIGRKQAIAELAIFNIEDLKTLMHTDLFPRVFPT